MANRRAFLHTAVWSSALLAQSQAQSPETRSTGVSAERRVLLTGDGIALSPGEYARLLTKIADEQGNVADTYLHGGAVEQLEKEFAKSLGKERAMFLPTGTLANHLAVRELAGDKRRVIVQQESHLYRDEGDCAQFLSGLNLIPLSPGSAAMKLDEISAVVERALEPPFPGPVGAISIESPVRRAMGAVLEFDEMKRICAYCREKQIKTHLDGARVFLASAFTAVSPAQYAALFDTVYVSLYKYFNAPFGAILAGPAALIARVDPLRHQFGSMIYRGWESAAVALHYFNGFADRYAAAVRDGETLLKLLGASGKVHVERVKHGTNIAAIRLATGTTDALQQRLARVGIMLRGVKDSPQTNLQINETLNRRPPEEIAHEFLKALG